VLLPEEYIIQKFQSYCGGVKFLKYQNAYNGSCFLCREGNSWLKKKRCYYLVDDDVICCHNCGWYGKPLYWIKEVTHQRIPEILEEAKSFEFIPQKVKKELEGPVKPIITQTLPHDSINLSDPLQLKFWHNNRVVQDIMAFIRKRKLDIAAYKPRNLYVSLTDKVHQNRLVIPFFGDDNDILFYQTRAIYESDLQDKAKYIGKVGGEKSLFNFDKIDSALDYIFVLEGPINAFFCKNGVAVAGIQESSHHHFTPTQQKQLLRYPFHKKIWVLDSQWVDKAGYDKSKILVDQGETVFMWPEALGKKYKDFNDLAMALDITQVDINFILKNSFSGLQAKAKLLGIRR
jgi:hypothetical protein